MRHRTNGTNEIPFRVLIHRSQGVETSRGNYDTNDKPKPKEYNANLSQTTIDVFFNDFKK